MLMKPLWAEQERMEFFEILTQCRLVLGLKQYKIAEITNLSLNMLKRLEMGIFTKCPSDKTLKMFCKLYGLDFKNLKDKGQKHEKRIKKRAIPNKNLQNLW